MLHMEHWQDDVSDSLFETKNRKQQLRLMVGSASKCCDIEGKDFRDCMTKYHQHMGWEPYVPVEGDDEMEAP